MNYSDISSRESSSTVSGGEYKDNSKVFSVISDYGKNDYHPFVHKLLPFVKEFSYVWFHLQAYKRKLIKCKGPKPSMNDLIKQKVEIMNTSRKDKELWAVQLLTKLRRDIKPDYRDKFLESIAKKNYSCVISNPDLKGKMRRIDCLRKADKVWRLDIVMVILFKGIPLESTDSERIQRSNSCHDPELCVNPYHMTIVSRELDLYLAMRHIKCNENSEIIEKYIEEPPYLDSIPANCEIISAGAFSLKEYQEVTTTSINSPESENYNKIEHPTPIKPLPLENNNVAYVTIAPRQETIFSPIKNTPRPPPSAIAAVAKVSKNLPVVVTRNGNPTLIMNPEDKIKQTSPKRSYQVVDSNLTDQLPLKKTCNTGTINNVKCISSPTTLLNTPMTLRSSRKLNRVNSFEMVSQSPSNINFTPLDSMPRYTIYKNPRIDSVVELPLPNTRINFPQSSSPITTRRFSQIKRVNSNNTYQNIIMPNIGNNGTHVPSINETW
uniref:CTF/NF-I domain-containing protein n=1 Tax=Strongyloides papillosus TaxID=174720 RepID=A0A0N5BG55_STREA